MQRQFAPPIAELLADQPATHERQGLRELRFFAPLAVANGVAARLAENTQKIAAELWRRQLAGPCARRQAGKLLIRASYATDRIEQLLGRHQPRGINGEIFRVRIGYA